MSKVEARKTRWKYVDYAFYCDPVKTDSHIASRAHAAPMPFPCHSVPLRV